MTRLAWARRGRGGHLASQRVCAAEGPVGLKPAGGGWVASSLGLVKPLRKCPLSEGVESL